MEIEPVTMIHDHVWKLLEMDHLWIIDGQLQ